MKKQPEEDSGKASKGRPESARRTPREIQIKQEERKSLVDIPRLPPASGNRMLQNLENFESMPFMSKIESLRAAAKFHSPIDIEMYFVTTLLEDNGWGRRTSMCKEYTAPRNQRDSRPFASIDANQKIDPILNIEIALIVDVPGIEVRVPSLSDLWRSMWILTSRGKERFVNEIHRDKPGIANDTSLLRTKDENLENVSLESVKPLETVVMVQMIQILRNRMINLRMSFDKLQYPRHLRHPREAAILLCMHITERKRSQGKTEFGI